MTYTVYQHRNLKNGKSYIGMTSLEPKKRWNSGKGYKKNSKIWSDIKESDWNSDWQHEILGKFENKQEALNAEEMFIRLFDSTNNGYNISSYGGTSYKRTEESRKKMSESKIGKKNPNFGKHFSEETRNKMSEAHTGGKHPLYGKHHSEKTRKKISESKPKKPVLQYSKTGELIAEYSSIHEAERQTGCRNGSICECCKGNLKTCGGYIWKYKEI